MSQRTMIQVITALVVGVFAAGIWLTGGEVQPVWLRLYSVAVAVALAGIATWDRVLWRWSPFQKLRSVPRDLRGTWKGTLQSFWEDSNTGEPPPPMRVYLVVRQTASKLSAVLLTDESRSVSTFAKVTDDGTIASLDYMYLNRPDIRFDHRSRIHHGSASLDVIGRPAVRLRGRYWTSRDTRGELTFNERRDGKPDDFAGAAELFGLDEQPKLDRPHGAALPPATGDET